MGERCVPFNLPLLLLTDHCSIPGKEVARINPGPHPTGAKTELQLRSLKLLPHTPGLARIRRATGLDISIHLGGLGSIVVRNRYVIIKIRSVKPYLCRHLHECLAI
jgi:hypothetical protein